MCAAASIIRIRRALGCILLAGLAAGGVGVRAADNDFSAAEKLIFMSPQLAGLSLPASLRYHFRKSGSLEAGFDDRVTVQVTARADGRCCAARGEFLSGARRLQLPDLESAEANPVVMYFLERDVREMHRLTKGSQSYFRKRLRLALYRGASVRDVELDYRGRPVRGQEVVVEPFRDDPNRARFERFARKEYRFWLSDAVPGGVFGMQSRVSDATPGAAPLITEHLLVDGGRDAMSKTTP